ncbi:hypothetical protein [Thermus neutrinimicus]|uniref:hypothetical protein n=1 Tax=Thermus neutrinimicus TaxID=2908149 RepID=UPI001FAAD538|nr:hypothetical protein [Thermus neutrinimicus]
MELNALAHELEGVLQRMLGSAVTSSRRQDPLADYLLSRLGQRLPSHLLPYLQKEAKVPGLAREKSWDLGLIYPGGKGILKKPRILISLKSILANPSGAWPNRLDDLIGEVSSVQMLFPEVVVGYVAVLDRGAPREGKRPIGNELEPLYKRFKQGLAALSKREPPLWAQGLIEGHWVVEIDTRSQPSLLDPEETVRKGEVFVDALVDALRKREPLLFLGRGE